jgi:predicted ArsR family transcriptional regulator
MEVEMSWEFMDVVPRVADMPLFSQRAPSVRGSATSREAAESLDAKTLNALQRRVLEFITARPDGATDEEIASGLGLNPSTARPRRIELARRGLIVEAGVRKTASKRNAVAWRCV